MKTISLKSRVLAVATVCVLIGTPNASADPAPAPAPAATPAPALDSITNLDDLIKVMDKASEEANAKNEEFKQMQLDIEAKEAEVRQSKESTQLAQQRAEEARNAEGAAKATVDKLAQSRYRGLQVDPLTAVFDAQGPQNAIDRSAYMSAYARRAQEALERQQQATAEAAKAHGEASRLEAEQNFQMADLQVKRAEIEKQEKELKQRVEDVKKRVDSLSAEDRAKWESKNGPVAYDLSGVTGSNADGMKALEMAMTKLGSPYGWGATGPSEFDCSGLVVWSYAQQGKSVPRTSQAQMAGGAPVDRADLQPGDVVGFYPGATHVAIYAGNGKVVHASDYGIPVQVVNMDSMPFYGARRY